MLSKPSFNVLSIFFISLSLVAVATVRILSRFLTQLLKELVFTYYVGMFACKGCERLESAIEERTAEELTVVFVHRNLTNVKADIGKKILLFIAKIRLVARQCLLTREFKRKILLLQRSRW